MGKKDVVFVNHHQGYNYAPVGPLYIINALEQAGYRVTFIDSRMPAESVLGLVNELNPLMVAASVWTSPTIHRMVEISQLVRSSTTVPVVWGGVHPTILPEQVLADGCADYVVKGGEGEDLITQLARDLETGTNLNVRIREKDAFMKTQHLDAFQPAWHHVDGSQFLYKEEHSVRGEARFSRDKVFYYTVTSRGCPFRCTFCYITTVHKSTWRPHSVEWVKNQVQYLYDTYGINGIGFWDDFFLVDIRRALEIMKFLKEKDIGFLCESRVTILTDAFMQKLKEHNCMQLFVGAESGSPRTLKLMKKDLMPEDILRAADLGLKHGVPIRASFMFGFPGETLEDMILTKELILKLLDYPNVSISGPKLYTPYPGTESYQEALKYGFVPPQSTVEWKNINRTANTEFLPWFKTELDKHRVSKEEIFLEVRDKEREIGIRDKESWYTKLLQVDATHD